MKTTKRESGTRAGLLQAAGRIILADGVASLTLEAVAREAGVSKGGLLYHFPTKDALISGMLTHQVAQFEALIDQLIAADTGPVRGRWVRAFVRATFETDPHENTILVGLLAALATNPELLAPLKAAYDRWDERLLQDGLDPESAMIARLATDGLLFASFFGLNPPAEPFRSRVMTALLERSQA